MNETQREKLILETLIGLDKEGRTVGRHRILDHWGVEVTYKNDDQEANLFYHVYDGDETPNGILVQLDIEIGLTIKPETPMHLLMATLRPWRNTRYGDVRELYQREIWKQFKHWRQSASISGRMFGFASEQAIEDWIATHPAPKDHQWNRVEADYLLFAEWLHELISWNTDFYLDGHDYPHFKGEWADGQMLAVDYRTSRVFSGTEPNSDKVAAWGEQRAYKIFEWLRTLGVKALTI